MAAIMTSRVPYLEIAADIREQIRSGRLMPGDKLRSLRSLAADYSVAQGTVAVSFGDEARDHLARIATDYRQLSA